MAEWVTVYDLRRDLTYLDLLEKASAGPGPMGIVPEPAPAGSPRWLAALDQDEMPTGEVHGLIQEVYWASMADYPEFTVVDGDGVKTTWARQGNIRLFVPGIAAAVAWVEVRFKPGAHKETSRLITRIDLEASDERSSGITPGPGGHGYARVGGPGTVLHYVRCSTRKTADSLEERLGDGYEYQTFEQPPDDWWLRIAGGEVSEVGGAAAAVGTSYDGGERVVADQEPEVWGPSGIDR